MPRTKAATKTKAVPLVEHLNEEDAATYHTILQDFDKQWANKLAEYETDIEKATKEAEKIARLELMPLTKKEREMKWSDVMGQLRVEEPDEKELMNEIDQVKATTRSVRKAATVRKTTTRGVTTTAKKKSVSAQQAPATVRRSTRKRIPKNHDFQTPVSTGVFPRPMITPKFDTSAPLYRTVTRLAKPDETLVSLSGSPVAPVTIESTVKKGKLATTRKANAKKGEENEMVGIHIPLGKGKTMVLPTEELEKKDIDFSNFDLDEDAKKRLLKAHAALGSILSTKKGRKK